MAPWAVHTIRLRLGVSVNWASWQGWGQGQGVASLCAGSGRGGPGLRHRSTALLRLRVVHAGCALRCSRTQYVTIAYCCGWRGVVWHKRHVRGACARNRILRTAAWLLRANLGTAQASCVLCRAAPCIALACGAGLLIELALDIRERMRRSRRASQCILP